MALGRKAGITVLGIITVAVLAVVAMVLARAEMTATTGAIGLMVATFCGANAYQKGVQPASSATAAEDAP